MHNGLYDKELWFKCVQHEEFPVRKGVPLPRDGRGRGRPERYPWSKMAVGDSFVVPIGDMDARQRHAWVSTATKHASNRYGHKYKTRRVEGGIGVWRVE